jgi:retinol-binding protein 3
VRCVITVRIVLCATLLVPSLYAQAPNAKVALDATERQRVVDGAIANLRQHYFDRDVAQKTTDLLLAHQKRGDYNSMSDASAFADLLTKQIRDASHDMHLKIDFSAERLPDGPPVETPEDQFRHRKFVEQNNCFIREKEILPQNIGYLKLDWFSEATLCRQTIAAALASLNNASAIIFDLRDNRGGFPDMVMFIASYLFDHPEYMFSPREAPTEESWTKSPIAGNKLADRPVYILTSGSTLSGAEQFCYDLKMLKRASLVGKTTGGGAHAGAFHRIDDHFGVGIPEQRAINPFGKADWEGIGVEPNVKVKAADALETAERLVERRLQKK